MFATIKSLIPEPRQADQPKHYVGRHRQPETVTARAVVPAPAKPVDLPSVIEPVDVPSVIEPVDVPSVAEPVDVPSVAEPVDVEAPEPAAGNTTEAETAAAAS
ncbi:hypothetical protein [Actinoplanes sp. N902-109]|uniref:hypothetical protein n=1 Tax=Actinoplanes sp. (strain N902-109) TaxID=649831 RepID=UPI00032951A2|nr:hypothetical protein [Actinoplanes sp. N902-109]AGL13590.1 hypothetical protein L083_0080 [Actinoplanes sp. N902-109]